MPMLLMALRLQPKGISMKCSSQYLSRPFPCFLGITLVEVIGVMVIGAIASIGIGIILGWMLGYTAYVAPPVFLLGMALSIYKGPKYLASLKEGKPHGYIKKILMIKLYSITLANDHYKRYSGIWSRKKSIGDPNAK